MLLLSTILKIDCHGSIFVQENNILASLEDNSKIFLIDYEYGMWNPKYYDLGNYLNEVVVDNAHPKPPGVKAYFENWPTDSEIEYLTKQYVMLEKQNDESSSDEQFTWSLDNTRCEECVNALR